jgi:NAD(P)-dependent dehydrogenase (short-subunit alcohol dehydrogenase family)
VVITYQRGKQEAEAIGREAAGAGVSITPLPFDVTAEPDLALLPAGFQPTHLYYLATPFIRLNAGRRLDLPALARFMDFYVAGLYRTVEAFSKRAAGPLLVWLPSTVFLESLERGAAPYCIAKAAMEELARQLPTLLPVRVVAPRLPRAATDQTAGLLESLVTDRAALAVEQLRQLARG